MERTLDSPTSTQLGPGGSTAAVLLRSPVTLVLAAVCLLTLHLGLGHQDFSVMALLGASTLGLLAFVAVRGARPDRLPFIPYFAANFYMVYGLPTLSEQRLVTLNGPISLSEEALTLATWSCALVLGVIMFAARLSRPVGRNLGAGLRRFVPVGNIQRHKGSIRAWGVGSLVLYAVIILTKLDTAGPWTFMLTLLASPVMAQSLLFAEWRAANSAGSRSWYWGFTAGNILLGLASGSLGAAATPMVAALILQWLARRPVRLAPILFLVGVGLIFNPAKFEYRKQVWQSSQEVSLLQRGAVWADALERTWGGESPNVRDNLEKTRSRLSELVFVAQVFDWVPRYVPESGFVRWKMIAYSYVPRAIWPNKPLLTQFFNADYAITFGLQSEEGAKTTAVNIPLVTEAYWTFGWLGVVLASALVGVLLGCFEGAFFREQWGMQALGMTFLLSLPAVGHLGVFYMGIAQRIAVGVGALWLIAGMAWLSAANLRKT